MRFSEALHVVQSTQANLPHFQPHVTDAEIHGGHSLRVYTHIFPCEFGDTSVHVCKGNIKH